MESDPEASSQFANDNGVVLLNDSGYQVGTTQFWGSPITPRFLDWSFMRDPGEPIEAHWRMIPPATDVLVTHGPPFGILDSIRRPSGELESTGCPSLLSCIQNLRLGVHIFGHIHEGRGVFQENDVSFHNVSSMNEHYRITHEPVVIELPD
jgi:Icc-related predicted phosphoesterase